MARPTPPLTIRLIAIAKTIEGLLFLIAGACFVHLIKAPDLAETLRGILSSHHLDPDGAKAHAFIAWASGIPHGQLQLAAVGVFAYAVLYLVEGIGLWYDRPWAEWVTAIGTFLLIPFEISHLVHKPSWGITITLVLNLAVLVFLVWRIVKRQREHRLQHPAGSRLPTHG